MDNRRTLMVVHAHPDDEVFSTGGILAKHAAAGDRVVVVYATRGEEGELYDETLNPEEAKPRLGEIREREAREACRRLGVEEVYFLGYKDSGMAGWEQNARPDVFANAPLDEAAGKLYEIMRETRPRVVVTYDESGGYGHPDHIMTHRATVAAFNRARNEPGGPQKLYYGARSREQFRRQLEAGNRPSWLSDDFDIEQYGVPDEEITAFIDVAPHVPLKKAALATHRTQIKPDFFYLSIPDEEMRQTHGTEFFRRVVPPHRPGERESDLFAPPEGEVEAA